MTIKKGTISAVDAKYIKAHAGKMTAAEIAEAVGRSVAYVENFILNRCRPDNAVGAVDDAARVDIQRDLRTSQAWKRLKQEFSEHELTYFEEGYVKLMSQFKGDVLPTEETQVFQVIKFELLMSRNLMGRRQAQEDIERLIEMQTDFLAPFNGDMSAMTDDQKAFSINLDSQLRQARSDESTKTTEYVKLQERHDALMKNLKATRDQRFEKIEREGVDFLGVIRQLSDRDTQEREGRQMELMKLAAKTELERLGRPHKYDDNSMDNPVLCEDTVDMGPEEPPSDNA